MDNSMSSPVLADLSLARRLERAEARAGANFVEARARLCPDSGAVWIEVAGAYAMYDGVASPITQTFGLGLFEPVTSVELERIEAFFLERGAHVDHEVCPIADKSLWPLLNQRGYVPIEFSSVLFLPLAREWNVAAPANREIRVRIANGSEHELWAQTAIEGWRREAGEFAGILGDLMRVAAGRSGDVSFLAERNGRAIATGALSIQDGVALLAGASTIPDARNLGAQRALLASRLRYAEDAGCELAMMAAEPGSASQRNAERAGFRIAYTRIKWRRPKAGIC
jgi:hypothetical protein